MYVYNYIQFLRERINSKSAKLIQLSIKEGMFDGGETQMTNGFLNYLVFSICTMYFERACQLYSKRN